MKKICLLGGTGFIGKHLIHQLSKQGWHIQVPTRKREKHRELLVIPRVNLETANIYDQDQLNKQLAGCEVVINLVGILNETGRDGAGFKKAHVELPEKLIIACKANNVKRVLHLSTLNADAKADKSHYLQTKGIAEDLLHEQSDLNVTSFKPSVIFGEDDKFFNGLAKLLHLPSNIFTLPSSQTRISPVWINDVVAAMMKTLAENPEYYGQRYNLCGPKVYSLAELVKYLAKCLHLKRFIIPLKAKHSHLVARIMDIIPGTPYSLDNYYTSLVDSVCDDNGFSQLNITPRSIEMMLPKYFSNAATPRELYSALRTSTSRNLADLS